MKNDFLRYYYRLLKERLHNSIVKKYIYFFSNRQYIKNGKTIYLITSPEYGNIGDHAIADTIKEYMQQRFPGYSFQEVPDSMFDKQIIGISKKITEEDMVCLIGGGNFGVLYPNIEYDRRFLIKNFKKCRIYMFPQSSVWNESWYEHKQLNRSAMIYGKNKNLVMMARDLKTYELMKKYFHNDVFFTPDIVLARRNLRKNKGANNKTVLLCFRNDVEKLLEQETDNLINKILVAKGYSVKRFDTETYKSISIDQRKDIVNEAIELFSGCQYVITDRLHGMIFATISGTPCLAFDNTTHKVSGVANEWIKNDNVIIFNNELSLEDQIDTLLKKHNFTFDRENAEKVFNRLFENYSDIRSIR